jgi:hypothetical protein
MSPLNNLPEPGFDRVMKIARIFFTPLLLWIVLASCGRTTPTNAPTLTTQAPVVRDISRWVQPCEHIAPGKQFSELAAIEPGAALVLALDPEDQQWKLFNGFPALDDTPGQPKYLICLFRTRTFIANYLNKDERLIIPGYREDWQISIVVLATDEVFTTSILPGKDPADKLTFMRSPTPLREVVGVTPFEEARALLMSKLIKP